MRNPMLHKAILKILNRVETGLREKTLQDEVDIALDRATLTTDEFLDALRDLEDRELVIRDTTLLGETLWSISSLGKKAVWGA